MVVAFCVDRAERFIGERECVRGYDFGNIWRGTEATETGVAIYNAVKLAVGRQTLVDGWVMLITAVNSLFASGLRGTHPV